jgi:hypothetical protein
VSLWPLVQNVLGVHQTWAVPYVLLPPVTALAGSVPYLPWEVLCPCKLCLLHTCNHALLFFLKGILVNDASQRNNVHGFTAGSSSFNCTIPGLHFA